MKIIENGRMRICVQKTQYQNKDYLDVRNFYIDSDSGEMKPTQKGVSIPLDKAEDVLAAMVETLSSVKKQPSNKVTVYGVVEKRAKNIGVEKQFAFKSFEKARSVSGDDLDSEEAYIVKSEDWDKGSTIKMRNCTVIAVWDTRKSKWTKP